MTIGAVILIIFLLAITIYIAPFFVFIFIPDRVRKKRDEKIRKRKIEELMREE